MLYGKTGNDGMICMEADVDGIMLVIGVDDGGGFVFADELDGFIDGEVFFVSAIVDMYWGVWVSIIYCGLNGCIISWSGAADIKCCSWR